jgi:hypothetical protein
MWYVDDYNTGMARQFARIRDFIILHYCLTASCGAMATMGLPDTLAFKLHAWRRGGGHAQPRDLPAQDGGALSRHRHSNTTCGRAGRKSSPPLKSIVNAALRAGSTNFSLSSASPVMSN